MSKSVLALSETIDKEARTLIYNQVRSCPRWRWDHATNLGDTTESPNPILKVITDFKRAPECTDEIYELGCTISTMQKDIVKQLTGRDAVEIEWLNFQITFEGHHGRYHTDCGQDETRVTVVTMITPDWKPEYGGAFYIEIDDQQYEFEFQAGMSVAFDSSLRHTGVGARIGSPYPRLMCCCMYVLDQITH